MGLEAAVRIEQLDPANPVGGVDQVSQGDDHLRMIKQCLRNSFPNFTGAVTVTDAQLNAVVAAVAALPTLASGRIDNPAISLTSNFTATGTAGNNELHYIRVGDIVYCTGQIRGTIGAAGAFSFNVALPIASNLAAAIDDLNGLFNGPNITSGVVQTDAVNNAASFSGSNTSGVLIQNCYFHFSYRVLP